MDKIKDIIIWFIIFLVTIGLLSFNPKDEKIVGSIRLGISNDTSGFVVGYMKNKNYFENIDIENLIEPYEIVDC